MVHYEWNQRRNSNDIIMCSTISNCPHRKGKWMEERPEEVTLGEGDSGVEAARKQALPQPALESRSSVEGRLACWTWVWWPLQCSSLRNTFHSCEFSFWSVVKSEGSLPWFSLVHIWPRTSDGGSNQVLGSQLTSVPDSVVPGWLPEPPHLPKVTEAPMALEAGSLVFLEAHHRACSLEPFNDQRSTKFLILTSLSA